METDLELKNIDDNQLNEVIRLFDDGKIWLDTEAEVDGLIIDIDEEENLVATTVPQTPRPSLYLHSETLGGSVYWEPNVESIYLPIEGKVFDTIEECVDFYTFYAEIGGFEVKKSAPKKTKSGLICKEIYDETNFKERFNKIVWNMFMEPMEFKEKWSKLIEDFGLKNHKWMTKMFNLRRMWLPAYFIDSPMFGLMRTTSRSDSENAFFKSFTSHGSTLVNFMMCFELAMERQRYRQEVLDFRTFDSAPKLHTKLKIEIHVSKVYTRKIFLLVQKEIIEAVWACQILECKTEEGCEIVKVRDKRAAAYRTLNTEKEKEVVQQKQYVAEYKVLRSLEDGSVECTCRHFLRYGFLCRQAFCVLKNRDIECLSSFKKNVDVMEDIYAVEKPQQNDVHNPQRARNKGEKANKHTKSTCPSNPKYVAKLARLAAAEQGTTAAAAEQGATSCMGGIEFFISYLFGYRFALSLILLNCWKSDMRI
ncbi:FAR1-related sequence 5-like protein [Tanacetum coccineum]